MAPICKISTRAQVLELISQQILSGGIRPDERINESQLAREFKVSQTPIREALLTLEGKGFLVSRPDKGFYVRPLNIEEIQGLYPVLAHLESLAFSLVPSFRATKIARMRSINARLALASGEAAARLDEAWHAQLLAGCGNEYLLRTIDRVRVDMKRYEMLLFLKGGNPQLSAAEHDTITDLIEAGHMLKARAALEDNCLNTVKELCVRMEEQT